MYEVSPQTKKNIVKSIENHEEEIIKISDKIWELARGFLNFEFFFGEKMINDFNMCFVLFHVKHLTTHVNKKNRNIIGWYATNSWCLRYGFGFNFI